MQSSIGRDTPYSFVSCQPPSLLPPLMYACNNFRRSLPTHQGAHACILHHTRFSSHVTLLKSLLVWFVDVGSGSITIPLCLFAISQSIAPRAGTVTCCFIHNRHFKVHLRLNSNLTHLNSNLPRLLYTMPFTCPTCRGNFRSQGGLTKHVNLKHGENSARRGKVKAAQSHTFIRHPHLSGMSKPIHDCRITEYV